MSAKLFTNFRWYVLNPKNCRSSSTELGVCQSRMQDVFCGSVSTPRSVVYTLLEQGALARLQL